jgi:hypothetical protein
LKFLTWTGIEEPIRRQQQKQLSFVPHDGVELFRVLAAQRKGNSPDAVGRNMAYLGHAIHQERPWSGDLKQDGGLLTAPVLERPTQQFRQAEDWYVAILLQQRADRTILVVSPSNPVASLDAANTAHFQTVGLLADATPNQSKDIRDNCRGHSLAPCLS